MNGDGEKSMRVDTSSMGAEGSDGGPQTWKNLNQDHVALQRYPKNQATRSETCRGQTEPDAKWLYQTLK